MPSFREKRTKVFLLWMGIFFKWSIIFRKPDAHTDMPYRHRKSITRKAAINDIGRCMNLGHDIGGYFAVPRLVLSYVDYRGHYLTTTLVGKIKPVKKIY